MTGGVKTHRIGGQAVRVFGLAKTVADCFKYRKKIGIDVALEALSSLARAPPQDGRAGPMHLPPRAQPYLEALTA